MPGAFGSKGANTVGSVSPGGPSCAKDMAAVPDSIAAVMSATGGAIGHDLRIGLHFQFISVPPCRFVVRCSG